MMRQEDINEMVGRGNAAMGRLDREIAALEQRARNSRAIADQCRFEAHECEAKLKELRRLRAASK